MENPEMLSFSADLGCPLMCYLMRWPIKDQTRHILRLIVEDPANIQEMVAEAIFYNNRQLLTEHSKRAGK
jgi:hypothetical protein